MRQKLVKRVSDFKNLLTSSKMYGNQSYKDTVFDLLLDLRLLCLDINLPFHQLYEDAQYFYQLNYQNGMREFQQMKEVQNDQAKQA